MYIETCKNFVCNCLGLYDGCCKYIDNLCKEFDVDFDAACVYNLLSVPNIETNFANSLICELFNQIIENVCKEYNCTDEVKALFTYDCQDYLSYLSFNGLVYTKKDELYNAVENYMLSQENK